MKEFDQEMLNVFLLTNPPQSHKSSQTEKMDIIEEEEQVERQGGWRVAQPDTCGTGRQKCFYPMSLGYDHAMGAMAKSEVEKLLANYSSEAVSFTGDLLG